MLSLMMRDKRSSKWGCSPFLSIATSFLSQFSCVPAFWPSRYSRNSISSGVTSSPEMSDAAADHR